VRAAAAEQRPLAAMNESVDYSRYTLAQLRDAQAHVNREAYPEIAAEIDSWVARREEEQQARAELVTPAVSEPSPEAGKTNQVLFALGLVAIGVIVIGVVVFGISTGRAWLHSAPSRAAARQIVIAVATNWDASALEERASSDLKKTLTPETRDRIFAAFRHLGHMQTLGEPTGGAKVWLGFGAYRSRVTAEYRFPATYETGSAIIRVRVVLESGAWKVEEFFVNSDVLLKD